MINVTPLDILILLPKVTGKILGFAISRPFFMFTFACQKKPNCKEIIDDGEIVEYKAFKYVLKSQEPQSYHSEIVDFKFNFTLKEVLKEWIHSKEFSNGFLKGAATTSVLYMAYKLLNKCREMAPEEAEKIASNPFIGADDSSYYYVELGGE